MKFISLFLLTHIVLNISFGKDSDIDREGGISDPFLLGTIYTYKKVCDVDPSNIVLPEHLEAICNIVIKSDVCKELEEENLLKCDEISHKPQLNLWEYYKGCAKGVGDFFQGFFEFVWIIIETIRKGIKTNGLQDGNNPLGEYFNGFKLYIHSEYEKAYAKTSPPLRKVKAASLMTTSLSKQLLDMVLQWLQEKNDQAGCLNFEARTRMTCNLLAELYISPKAACFYCLNTVPRRSPSFILKLKSPWIN